MAVHNGSTEPFNTSLFKNNYYKYFNLRKKWLINNSNIWFNKTCLQRNIIPKFAILKNKTYSIPSRITKKQYSTLRLKNEIRYLYQKKQNLTFQSYQQELQNSQFF